VHPEAKRPVLVVGVHLRLAVVIADGVVDEGGVAPPLRVDQSNAQLPANAGMSIICGMLRRRGETTTNRA
jgi:hypothetical protein